MPAVQEKGVYIFPGAAGPRQVDEVVYYPGAENFRAVPAFVSQAYEKLKMSDVYVWNRVRNSRRSFASDSRVHMLL